MANNDSLTIDTFIPSEQATFCNTKASDLLLSCPSESFDYALKALNLSQEHNLKLQEAQALKLLAEIYSYKSDFEKSLDYYQQSLKIYKSVDDSVQIGNMVNRIGYIYEVWSDFDMALKNYMEALEILSSVQELNGIAAVYNNLAIIYGKQGNDDSSLYYYKAAYAIQKKVGCKDGIGVMANNLGQYYITHGEYLNGESYYKQALTIFKKIENWYGYSFTVHNIGAAHFEKGEYDSALFKYRMSLEYASKYGLKELQGKNFEALSSLYDSIGNIEKAYYYHKLHTQTKDSVFNETIARKISDLRNQFEIDGKEKEIELLKKQNQLKDLKNRRKSTVIIIGIVFIVLIITAAMLIYRAYRLKNKTNKLLKLQKEEIVSKNEELKQQQEEIISQKDNLILLNGELTKQKQAISIRNKEISQQNKYITDSIEYAKHIQSAILVSKSKINCYFKESFIFYRAKDIVSGDFFWIEKKKSKIYFAAVDCTGHGVPGAFMSIVGNNLLNKAINDEKIDKPAEILNFMNSAVHRDLKKDNGNSLIDDGMDIALCSYDTNTQILEYSGAFSPLYLIRNNEIIRYKADALPVGTIFNANFDSFSNQKIQLQTGDLVFIFSDGFIDQFGGKYKKKFQSKNFKKLLLSIADQPPDNQKRILEQTFDEWKGDNVQIDDVLVIGVKIE